MAEKNIAISTIQIGDEEGRIKEFQHGEKVTGLSKERHQELVDAGVLVSRRRYDFLFPPDEDEEEAEAEEEETPTSEGEGEGTTSSSSEDEGPRPPGAPGPDLPV